MGSRFHQVPFDPAAKDVAEVVLMGHFTNSDGGETACRQVFNFFRNGGTAPGDEGYLAEAVRSALAGPLAGVMPEIYTLDQINCRFLDDPANGVFEYSFSAITGTVAGDSCPGFVCVTQRLDTSYRGRSFRGRKHWSPVPESFTTLDRLNSTSNTPWGDMDSAVGSLTGLTDGGGHAYVMIVLSPTRSLLADVPGRYWSAVTVDSVTRNADLGTMDSRKERNAHAD